MKPDRLKKAPPIFRWLLFALIFLSQVPVYAAAPKIVDGYPKLKKDETTANSFKLLLKFNTDVSTIKYIVLKNGATVPTDTQIKDGKKADGTDVDAAKQETLPTSLAADTETTTKIITGLEPATPYNIFIVAVDDADGHDVTTKSDVVWTLGNIDGPIFDTDKTKVKKATEDGAFDLTVETDKSSKAYYIVVDKGSIKPSAAQVKAHATYTGVNIIKNDESSTDTTNETFPITGLEANKSYDLFVMADASGNVSTVYEFELDGIKPTLTVTTPVVTTDTTADLKVKSSEAGKAYYALFETKETKEPSAAQVKAGKDSADADAKKKEDKVLEANTEITFNIDSLKPNNKYYVYVLIEDEAGNARTDTTSYPLEFTTSITGNYTNTGTIYPSNTITGTTTITGGTLDGIFDFTASGLDVTLKDVILAAKTKITGGKLEGTITGDDGISVVLEDVEIADGAILKNVIIGDGVTFGINVTLENVTFTGKDIKLSTVILKGNIVIVKTSITVIENVTFEIGFTGLSGGTLSGTVETAAGFTGSPSLTGLTLKDVTDFKAVGISITNVTLQGTFTTTSTITLTNVTFGAGVTITGTQISLAGTIQPITPTTVVNLTNLKIADNSIVLKGVTLGSGVTQGTAVQVLTQTLTTIPSVITSTTVINNVSIPAGATITGGILGGAIIGNALNPPILNVTSIASGAILSNVILGRNVAILPLNITLGVGVQFQSLSIISFNFNLTSILPVFTPPVIIGVTLPPILDLSGGLIAGGGSLFSAITPTRTANVFGGGARIKRRKGRLSIKLKAKRGKRPAMCGFRPSRARRRGRRRRAADDDNSYGFGNALYITTPDDVEIKNQPSVQNLEALQAKLKTMGYSNFTVKDNGNISVEKDDKTINFRPSITSDEVDASTPLGFKDNKSFEKGVLTTFIFDDVDEEDGTTRREQVLYPAPASLDDITDESVTILNKNDQDGGSYKEDGEIEFKLGGKTYKGTLDYYVETGASTRAPGITVTDNSDYFLITYTDGTKQKLFKVVITTPPVQQPDDKEADDKKADDKEADDKKADDKKADDSSDGGSTTPPVQQTDTTDKIDDKIKPVEGKIDNTGILENISLSTDAVIDGGILQGTITGSADGTGKLNNLEIVANSYVSNVTIGKNVTFGKGVTLKDVVFMGASLSDVTLEGIIRTASSGTVITNATLKANAKVIGGKLAGIIKGDSAAPALLEFLTIEANSQLTYVIIADGVDIPVDAKLGKGVKFTAAKNIPFNVDLTAILPSIKDTIVDLSADLIVDGKGLLITINALPAFAANGFKMDQSDKSGLLKLKIESFTFAVTPVKVKRVDSNTRAADQSLRLGFGNTVYFKTDDGIEVEAHPAVQDLTTLETLLTAIEIPKIEITKEGNIKVPVTDKLWFSGRAALASEASEAEVGFTFKGDLVVLVFEKDGQKRQQVLYPAPASNAVIQLTEEASLTEEGVLSFKVGETAYKGKLDYAVEKGEVTENSGVTEIADSNGDGLPDFLITYPQGDKQKLFALPPAEAATE